jgi:hypothetical protein
MPPTHILGNNILERIFSVIEYEMGRDPSITACKPPVPPIQNAIIFWPILK